MAGGGAWTGGVVFVGHCWMGKASAVLVLVGVVLTVVGSTVQVSLQPTSAHRLLTSACMCVPFEMIKPFYVTSTAVHNLTSDVYMCVFVNGSQMTAFLFLIRKCVSCEAVGDSLCQRLLSYQATQSHTACCFSRLDVKYWS